MTSFAILLILVGVFIAINTPNLVGVVQGNKTFTAASGTATPATNAAGTTGPPPTGH